ncbi:Neuroendocrine convertase 2 [Cichlidogyrus casuarinus]|uniref:Neuroendocrine convertase 2 n=1 Tax=Cichlidogyrus casuarinus TaxID=1844966 RepID=A0ABD2PYG2_9PLAT
MDAFHSFDVVDNDPDPYPDDEGTNWLPKSHGTRCAGQIAMVANNSLCGVGVAPDVNIAGIRLLSGPLYDYKEAKALSFKQQGIDIYSSSWGPRDNGKTIEGPGPLAKAAIYTGVTKGRGGKGNIYVWASGNGGERQDSCAFDGYVSSPYTVGVGSVSDEMDVTSFSEPCAAIITASVSGWNNGKYSVVTTDLAGKCTTSHGGTSASAPFVSGAIALAIEAERRLTWRDVQHLLVLTSNPDTLKPKSNWTTNAAGHRVHPYFGFGLLDVYALVKGARQWYSWPNYGLGDRMFCRYDFIHVKLVRPAQMNRLYK